MLKRFTAFHSTYFYLSIYTVFALASSYLYRLGSARIDKGLTPGMRDLGTYQFAGRSILEGNNPYVNPQVRIGPLGSFFIGILDWFFPQNLLAWIALLSVPISLGIFVKVVLLYERNRSSIAPWLLLLPWLSSTRENLVNIQITGFILLLFSLGLRITTDFSNSDISQFVGCFFLAIAIDMKPHLLVLLLIVTQLRQRKFGRIFVVIGIILSSHVFLSLYTQTNLTQIGRAHV